MRGREGEDGDKTESLSIEPTSHREAAHILGPVACQAKKAPKTSRLFPLNCVCFEMLLLMIMLSDKEMVLPRK